VRSKVPGIGQALSEQVVHFVQSLRKQDLFKAPGVAETLDWAAALAELDVGALDPATVTDTLGVLLIDEVDRADEAFEAFLLEVLAEWQVTIPELGTIRAARKPHVILTSNRTRELSDALRRRCLFLWLPYPSLEQEIGILHARVPGLSQRLAQQIGRLMQVLRGLPLQKAPGVAESLDWALALMSLHRDHLDARALEQTLGCVLKVHEDHAVINAHHAALEPILQGAPAALDSGGHDHDSDFGFGSVSTPRG